MAITVAEIVAKIRAEGADQVVSEMKKGEAATGSFTKSLGSFGKSATDLGKKATLGLTLPIVGMGIVMVKSASDLNEATSAVKTTYGSAADLIIEKSNGAAESVGLSREQYRSAATQLGVFGQGAGLTGKDLANFGSSTIQAAGDLASFYNAPVPEALEAIRAGLTGETEPLRRFGIMMSDAEIKAYAMAHGIGDGSGELTEQQKILARQGYIMDHLGAAQDDFSKTSGGLANQQRILRAQLTDVAADMGQMLLPMVLRLVTGFAGLLQWVHTLSPGMQRWVLIIAGAAAAVGPLLVIIGTLASTIAAAIPVITAMGGAFTLLLGPVGLVVLALAAIGIAYKKNLFGFGDAVDNLAGHVKHGITGFLSFAKAVKAWFSIFRGQGMSPIMAAFSALGLMLESITGIPLLGYFQTLATGVERFFNAFKKIGEGIGQTIKSLFQGDFAGALDGVRKTLSGLGDLLAAPWKILGQALTGITTGFAPLDLVLHNLGKTFVDIGRLFQEVFQGDFKGALAVAERLVGHLADTIKSEVNLAVTGIKAAFNSIDWGGLLDAAIGLVSKAIGMLIPVGKALLQGVVDGWNAIKPTLSEYASGLGQWVLDQITDAPGKLLDIGKALLQGVLDGWDAIKPTLSSYASGLAGWVLGLITDAPGKLLSIGQALLQGVIDGWDAIKPTLSSYASGLAGWVLGLITDAPGKLLTVGSDLLQGVITGWDAVKPTLASYATGLASWVLAQIIDAPGKLLSVGSALLQSVLDGWDTIKPTLQAYASGLASWVLAQIIDAPTALLSIGAALIQGLLDGWDSMKPTLTAYATGLGAWVAGLMVDAGTALVARGGQLIDGLMQGWTAASNTFSGWVKNFPTWVFLLMADAGTALLARGGQLIDGLMQGWTKASNIFSGWVKNFPSWVKGLMTAAGTALVSRGTELITGLMNGWTTKSKELATWAAALPSWVLSQIDASEALSALSGIGGDLVAGVVSGIQGSAYKVTDAAQAIINSIPASVRGLLGIGSPSKVMRNLFYAVPEGAALGITDGLRLVTSAAGDLSKAALSDPMIADFSATATGRGTGTIYTPSPLPATSSPARGGDTYIIMTRSELAALFETVDVVKVLTTPEEISAAWGR